MFRRHSWLKPFSSSSSERPVERHLEHILRLPGGEPLLGRRRPPPSAGQGGRDPLPDVVGGISRYVGKTPRAAVGDGGLDGRGRPSAAHDRRAHLDAERTRVPQVVDHRVQPARQVVGGPVEHRALRQVGQEPLHLRHLPQQHQADAHEGAAIVVPAEALGPPLLLDGGPRRALQERRRRPRFEEPEVLGVADLADGEHGRRGSCQDGTGGTSVRGRGRGYPAGPP